MKEGDEGKRTQEKKMNLIKLVYKMQIESARFLEVGHKSLPKLGTETPMSMGAKQLELRNQSNRRVPVLF